MDEKNSGRKTDIDLEKNIEKIIREKVREINRPDLFREPHVGFASLADPALINIKETVGPWHEEVDAELPGAKSVIAYYVPFTRKVAEAPNYADYSSLLWSETYTLINSWFAKISEAVKDYLVSEGYDTVTIKATNNYDPADMITPWSHRTMAVACGLGSFGKNRILITEKGSAVRLCSIITMAELKPSGQYHSPSCLGLDGGSCNICWDICPADALSHWLDGGKKACQSNLHYYLAQMADYADQMDVDTCGKCISACPLAYIE